jgi:ribosomal protein S18 acetylase RimI-like enzyme
MIIRNCQSKDLPKLVEIWNDVGLTIGLSDTIPELEKLLIHNPETCLVIEDECIVVGGVLGGFDGRRGLVHHLAVKPEYQGRKYGMLLMQELEKRFIKIGVVKISLWIEADNTSVIEFYKYLSYQQRNLITMSKTLRK